MSSIYATPDEQSAQAERLNGPTELYRHFDADGSLLYVGISLSAVARLRQHKNAAAWQASIARVEIEQHPSRIAAMEAERRAILEEKPRHNVLLTVASPKMLAKEASDRLLRKIHFRIFYSISELSKELSIPTSSIKKMLDSGEMDCVVVHGRRIITGWNLIDYLERLHGKPIT